MKLQKMKWTGIYPVWGTIAREIQFSSNISCHSDWEKCIRSPKRTQTKSETGFYIPTVIHPLHIVSFTKGCKTQTYRTTT